MPSFNIVDDGGNWSLSIHVLRRYSASVLGFWTLAASSASKTNDGYGMRCPQSYSRWTITEVIGVTSRNYWITFTTIEIETLTKIFIYNI